MTSHDVRDMLDLPSEASKPAKKLKVASAPRPVLKGLAREVQSLSGDNPIAIVPEVSIFKKRRFANRKPAARWGLKPFKNTARDDQGLILRHWRRKGEVPPTSTEGNGDINANAAVDDSTFAKYNVRINVPRYADDQYKEKLENPEWTRDETDYLMDLVEQFDLRWPVIWDRYEYAPAIQQVEGEDSGTTIIHKPRERTVEDLKARYYTIAAHMMAVNTPLERMKEAEFQLHELMLHFNPTQEKLRKHYAETLLHRSVDDAREEESLLMELKRILARSETLGEERRELYARLEAPPSSGNIGVYTSSQGLQQLLQQLMSVDKSKKRKSLMGSEGISPPSGAAGPSVQSNYDRRDSNVRESISGPSGASNNKKGPSQGPSERRQLTEEEERIYGVSHHERLTASGPAYRHEKISKPITSKSSIQQQKIVNVLNELEIPPRLVMPTAEVGELFEGLLASVHTLLEARKVSDKLTGEISILKAQKAEREQKERLERGEVEDHTAAVPAIVPGTDAPPPGSDGEMKVEESAVEASTGGNAAHKRSASVLSTVSDKSTKRHKK